ncbi:hypothetical protein MN608_05263 [Microdochium nivale]|nr:hypothetical protein MN608_05263 [Microdochium nivale]
MTRRLPWARNLPASTASGGSTSGVQNSPGAARAGPSTPAFARAASREVKAPQSLDGSGDDDDDDDDDGQTGAGDGTEHEPVATPSIPADPSRDRGRAVANVVGAGRAVGADRAGSTSPPPEPLREVYMIDGAEWDDCWRMVEDEFLATAQQFTAHLHAAEYRRLKTASGSRNAATIKNISRPVVGRMTDLVRMKQERKARSERIRREKQQRRRQQKYDDDGHCDDASGGAQQRDQDSEEDESDSAGNPYSSTSLFGLMQRPRKTATLLDPTSATATANASSSGARPVPLRSSPQTRTPRVLEGTPQPTFKSIPGLRNHSTRKVRQEDAANGNDETTGSDDNDLDTPFQQNTDGHRHLGLRGSSMVATTSGAAPRSSPRELVPKTTRQVINKPAVTSTSINTPSKPTAIKRSNSTSESEEEEGDILTRLKNRRASHKASRSEHRLGPI